MRAASDGAAVRAIHSPVNIAGGPGAISAGLRELGVESTLLVFNERPFERGFDVNLELRDTSRLRSVPFNLPKQLRALAWALRRFDVFHFHAGLTLAPRRVTLPLLRARRKGIVFQSWGSDLRGRSASEVGYLRAAGAVIVGSYLTRRLAPRGPWPEYDVVPPAIVLQDWTPSPAEPGDVLRVAHAPSKRAVKGTDAVLAAVESLRSRGAPIELDLIEGVPNREARLRYAAADVVVDQLQVGWYGMFAIESMALAKPVVVHLDEEAAAETEEAFGLELPLVRADESTLEDVLAGLVEVREQLPQLGGRSREYAERVHAHTAVARRVLEVYERVMPISS
jgi:glycosyltransferase involved in cell wall biosynthesis